MYVYVQRLACVFGRCNSCLLNPSGIAWGFLGILEEIQGGQSERFIGVVDLREANAEKTTKGDDHIQQRRLWRYNPYQRRSD